MVSSRKIPISYVVKADLDATIKRGPNGTFNITCPFCGGYYKLHVNEPKHVWRCAKCGEAGNAVILHKKLLHLDGYKTAAIDLERRYNGLPASVRADISKKVSAAEEAERNRLKPAPLPTRHKFYSQAFDQLTLLPKHRAMLRARGLTDEQIDHAGYKSYPTTLEERKKVARKAMDGIYLLPNEGIPGAYDLKTDPTLIEIKGGGIVIPMRVMTGLISGAQIRKDNLPDNASEYEKKHYCKYIWLSSASMRTGCSFSGCENLHFAGEGWPKGFPKSVYLTEGVLKADVASALSGKLFMGVAGVSNLAQLPDMLAYAKVCWQTQEVNICYDMDYQSKKEVRAAMDKLERIIKDAGLTYHVIKWSPEYKGIDDFLLHCKKEKEEKNKQNGNYH